MTRKCFMADDDGHWYAIPVDRRGFFAILLDKSLDEDDEDLMYEAQDSFNKNFGADRLDMDISNYSFDNLEDIGYD